MATQDESGITFSISREQQNFRLMELPPDLADVLSNNDAPMLQLSSSDSNEEGTSSAAGSSPVVLKVGDKVYQIRQVSTSNSVFLLQPSVKPSDDDTPARSGVTAVATIGSTLELLSGPSAPTTSRKWHERFKKGAQ